MQAAKEVVLRNGRPQVVAWWLKSPLNRVGLRFESQLHFFLPSITSRAPGNTGCGLCSPHMWKKAFASNPAICTCASAPIKLWLNFKLVRAKSSVPSMKAPRPGTWNLLLKVCSHLTRPFLFIKTNNENNSCTQFFAWFCYQDLLDFVIRSPFIVKHNKHWHFRNHWPINSHWEIWGKQLPL